MPEPAKPAAFNAEAFESATRNLATLQLSSVLNWTYDRVMEGAAGMSGAEALAQSYLRSAKDSEDAIDTLVKWQIRKAGLTGFVTNIGGAITLPAAIPANLAGTLYFQLQMIAAIAYIRGYDLRDDKVRTLVLGCLLGKKMLEPLRLAGIATGSRFAGTAIGWIVGSRVVGRGGVSGMVNFSKFVPVMGGLIGGAFDGLVTGGIAKVAKRIFVRLDGAPTVAHGPETEQQLARVAI